VKISIADLNVRKGSGTDYAKTGQFTGKGVFTITEEEIKKSHEPPLLLLREIIHVICGCWCIRYTFCAGIGNLYDDMKPSPKINDIIHNILYHIIYFLSTNYRLKRCRNRSNFCQIDNLYQNIHKFCPIRPSYRVSVRRSFFAQRRNVVCDTPRSADA